MYCWLFQWQYRRPWQTSAAGDSFAVGCSAAQLGCSAAQLVVRWLAVRQARVRISARHPREVPPTEPAAMKIWRRASAIVMREWLYECMYCNRKIKIYKKKSFAARADLCQQYSLSPVSLTPVRNNQKAKKFSPVSLIPVRNNQKPKVYRRYQRQCWKIVYRCQRHRW
jgi:hypothetical protein